MLDLKEGQLTLANVADILQNQSQIEVNKETLEKVASSFSFLEKFSAGKVIYGINTGLGPMAQYRVDEQHLKVLQLNLIRSHCVGMGQILTPLQAKACMLARLNSFLVCKSAVHPSLIILLKELINHDATPVLFEHGGVGASGDLVQLAHLALFLIGEGEGFYQGQKIASSEIFQKLGLKPLEIHIREGLGIMNGTSCMTGIGLLNILNAKRLLSWSITAAVMINELVESFDDHFSAPLNNAKVHKGQKKIAAIMSELLADSQLIKKREKHLYIDRNETVFAEKVQEYYSIRCVPQILGPIFDTISYSENILIDELNSANDNPVIDAETENVYHGGNFHGDYVALEMDKLKIAITKLVMLSERQINYLLNNKLNEKLPPFLNLGVLGLNLGLQGMQFSATSTTAECQTLSFPMYLHSIPNNADNQDIVSMGTNAALITSKVIENGFQVLAIQMIMLTQAFECIENEDKLSKFSKTKLTEFRQQFNATKTDRTFYQDIEKMKNWLSSSDFDSINPSSLLS
jgi:histidine ammonia-lyase